MARKARIKDEYGIFYITQTGGGNQTIFRDDTDRDHFLKILSRAQQKYQFKLYAYCLLKTDEYHIVINIDGGDISKVMKSINIAYAMYAKGEGKLFRDRYKSKLIEDQQELTDLILKIHNRNQEASLYNSYCVYSSTAPINIDVPFCDELKDGSLHDCKDCIKTLQQAENTINDIAIKKNMSVNELMKDKQLRNELIKQLRKNSTLSLKELGVLCGGLSESMICKILNQC